MTNRLIPQSTSPLSGSHLATYNAIFRHPAARGLHWRDVRSLLASLADVVEEPNGNLRISRGNERLVLHPSRDSSVAQISELMEIRHFLERSGPALQNDAPQAPHLLVVIDHRQARIYQAELHGTVPQRIAPYDPQGLGRYLHYVQDDSNGQRKPERKSFYEAVAKTLEGAEMILLFGSGTGASSAMDQLFAGLERRHPRIAGRVVGRVVVDAQHLTEDQLLAKARRFYAKLESEKATSESPLALTARTGAASC